MTAPRPGRHRKALRLPTRVWLALFVFALGAAPLSAHPALWVARNAQATVYLFGTVHLLPADTDWHFPALDRALRSSQSLYLEAADTRPALVQSLALRYGLDPAHPLSDRLDTAENTLLRKVAVEAGLPGGAATLQPMKPWLAALTLTLAPLRKAGLDPADGVDRQIKARMQKAGKPVHGFESAQKQVRILAGLPESVQRDFLRTALHEFPHALEQLKALVKAWQQGDPDALDRVGTADMRKHLPLLYQRLLVERNRAWAHTIAGLMHSPGTIFVAVGAAHLAGPDSLQHQLENLGIRVHRVGDTMATR